jgi:hypothetical protein
MSGLWNHARIVLRNHLAKRVNRFPAAANVNLSTEQQSLVVAASSHTTPAITSQALQEQQRF